MGESTRSVAQELVEQGVARVGELQELHGREDIERVFQERQQHHRKHQREDTVPETEDTQPKGVSQIALLIKPTANVTTPMTAAMTNPALSNR